MIRLISLFFLVKAFTAGSQPLQNNFLPGKTTGTLPFLEFGLGEDRLGGAKMTYLDTGILVKVIDSTIINYKVQLSENHFAYLSKTFFSHDSTIGIRS